jgi:hypothetical protein
VDPGEVLDAVFDDGAAIHRALRAQFADVVAELTAHGVTQAEWTSMSRPEKNAVTDAVLAQLVAKETEAVEAVRAELERGP